MSIWSWLRALGRPRIATFDAEMEGATRAAAGLIYERPKATDEELMQELQRSGVPREVAAQAVIFVPVAAMRLLYGSSGARFFDMYYLFDDATGRKETCYLSQTAAFVAAFEVLRATNNVELVQHLAMRSAEMSAMAKAATAKTNPKSLTFSPLAIRDWRSQQGRGA